MIYKSAEKGMRLNMELGSPLRIKIDGMVEMFPGVLVGMAPQEFLIARIPTLTRFIHQIDGNHPVFVRYLCLGSECGFDAKIIDHIETPFRLFFISHPRSVQSMELRKKSRVSCFIPASATLKGVDAKGIVADISPGGCRFVVRLPAQLEPQQIHLTDNVELSFPLLGIKGVQSFSGLVKSTSFDHEQIVLGIEFRGLQPRLIGKIEDYTRTVSTV